MSKNKIESLFKDKGLFNLALTHRSWVNEHSAKGTSNERLEFLGDAILEFIVSKELYKKFPDKEEGFLTAIRANLVNTVSLAEVAVRLDIGKYINLSKGEEETGGRSNSSILADTVEAIIGALFEDGGLIKAEKFVVDYILSKLDSTLEMPLKDPKSTFQELVQDKGFPAPKYEVIKEEGPDHAKIFTIEAVINGKTYGRGSGKNKSEAAQEAAKKALEGFLKKID